MSWSCICPLVDQVGRPLLGLGHPVYPVPRPSTQASSSCLHPNLWALWVHSLSAQILAPTPSYSPASLTWSSARFRPTGSNSWAHPFGRVLQIGFNDDTGQTVVMKWRAQSDKRHVKVQLAPLVPFSVFSLPFFPHDPLNFSLTVPLILPHEHPTESIAHYHCVCLSSLSDLLLFFAFHFLLILISVLQDPPWPAKRRC